MIYVFLLINEKLLVSLFFLFNEKKPFLSNYQEEQAGVELRHRYKRTSSKDKESDKNSDTRSCRL